MFDQTPDATPFNENLSNLVPEHLVPQQFGGGSGGGGIGRGGVLSFAHHQQYPGVSGGGPTTSIPRELQGNEKRTRHLSSSGEGSGGFKVDREQLLQHQLLLLRDECDRALRSKDAELAQLREAHRRADEENHVLKRGVAIQSARQREACSQNHELQEVLARAAEHIHGLERLVQQLRAQVASYEAGGADIYIPPPHGDCF